MRQNQGNRFSCDGCLVECRRGRGSSGRLLRREVQRRWEALRQPEVGTALRLCGRQDGGEYSQSPQSNLIWWDFSPGECLAERRWGVLRRGHPLRHLLQVGFQRWISDGQIKIILITFQWEVPWVSCLCNARRPRAHQVHWQVLSPTNGFWFQIQHLIPPTGCSSIGLSSSAMGRRFFGTNFWKKMLESRSEDALVLLVKLVKLDCWDCWDCWYCWDSIDRRSEKSTYLLTHSSVFDCQTPSSLPSHTI